MAHGDDSHGCAGIGRNLQSGLEIRDQNRQAFEREALGAEVAGLDHLLENLRLDQAREHGGLVDCRRGALHLRLNPFTPLRVGDVHEFDADGAAVKRARLGGCVVFAIRERGWKRLLGQVLAERVERRLQVSPAAEDVERQGARGALNRGAIGLAFVGHSQRCFLGFCRHCLKNPYLRRAKSAPDNLAEDTFRIIGMLDLSGEDWQVPHDIRTTGRSGRIQNGKVRVP